MAADIQRTAVRDGHEPAVTGHSRMSRRSGIRFADKDMRQHWNLQAFPFILDHRVIQYERESCL